MTSSFEETVENQSSLWSLDASFLKTWFCITVELHISLLTLRRRWTLMDINRKMKFPFWVRITNWVQSYKILSFLGITVESKESLFKNTRLLYNPNISHPSADSTLRGWVDKGIGIIYSLVSQKAACLNTTWSGRTHVKKNTHHRFLDIPGNTIHVSTRALTSIYNILNNISPEYERLLAK